MTELSPGRIRQANAVYFFISGFGYSSWTSRIPGIKESLKLNDAHFGTLLFMMPVGLILTLPLTGRLLDHYKSRTIMLIGTLFYNLVLACLGFSTYTWVLGTFLFFFGSSRNLMNLSINAQAVGVQSLYSRSIMSNFHAIWSLAGFAGAAVGYAMVTMNVIPAWHLMGVSLALSTAALFFYKNTFDQKPDHRHKRSIFTLQRLDRSAAQDFGPPFDGLLQHHLVDHDDADRGQLFLDVIELRLGRRGPLCIVTLACDDDGA